ncbi:hypothetical protein KZX50_00520 [Bacillus infantis]|uniref:phage adaptor protein n=1 Tax=Bacillus infantis TaxID=324767 RepID=UPI002004C8B8|nr:hypothetical protein [Bacillus infantis]MCK6203931.1 hypothetical protein [Bacillus infantis]
MKLSALIKEVNKDIDDSLPNADIIGWLNRALDDLSPIAKHKKKATLVLPAGTADLTLPDDVIEVVRIVQGGPVLNYEKWGSIITLPTTYTEDQVFTLYYYAQLPHLTNNPDDEPAIPSHFHDLLILYAVAKAKYQDEEPELQGSAWGEYITRKMEFNSFQSGDGEINQVRLVT